MKQFVFLIGLFLVFPAAVSAHTHMRQCSPKQGAVVTAPPKSVSLTFSNSIEPTFSTLTVVDSSGKMVSGKTVFLEGNTVMETNLLKDLTPGTYTVKWKCVSLDGHKQTGSYTFTVK
jgi:methionine-rich copper-binding protein CopC